MKTILSLLIWFFASTAFTSEPCYEEFSLRRVFIAIRDSEIICKGNLPFLVEINNALDRIAPNGQIERKHLEDISFAMISRYERLIAAKKNPREVSEFEGYLMVGILTVNDKANCTLVHEMGVTPSEIALLESRANSVRAKGFDIFVSDGTRELVEVANLLDRVANSPDPRFLLTAREIRRMRLAAEVMESWGWPQYGRSLKIGAALALGEVKIIPEALANTMRVK